MPRGRPRTRAAKHTAFSQWLTEFISDHPTASLSVLAEICGVDVSTIARWLSGNMTPSAEKAVRSAITAEFAAAPAGLARETPKPYKDAWLIDDWQQVRAFTALVEALRKVDKIHPKSPAAWKARAAWEAVLGASQFVRQIAGWTDQDWKRIHQKPLDHWRRPKFGQRAEEDTLAQWLQVELGFREGGTDR